MRIRGIYIDGFGVFRDQVITDLPDGLVLFLGPNESGKTTLMEFIRTMLFGPPSSKEANQYPPLRGGVHGGRLELVTGDGTTFVVQRVNGKGFAEPFPSLNRDIYCRVFAIGLDDLSGFQVLADSGLGLLGASAGLDARVIADALEYLEGRAGQLLKPRSKKGEINSMLERMEGIETVIRRARSESGEYRELQKKLEELQERISGLRARIEGATLRRLWLDDLERARHPWICLKDLLSQQRALSHARDLPRDLASSHALLKSRLSAVREDIVAVENQLKALQVEGPVLEIRAELAEMTSELAKFRETLNRLPELAERVRQEERALSGRLRDLGPAWDEERLAQADLSVEAQREGQRLADAATSARRHLEECRRELGAARQAFEDANRRCEIACKDAETNQVLWPEDQSQLNAIRDRLVVLRERCETPAPTRILLFGLIMIGIVGFVARSAHFSWPVLVALEAVLAGMLAMAYASARPRGAFMGRPLAELRELAKRGHGPLAASILEFCSRPHPTRADIAGIERRLEEVSLHMEKARILRLNVERAAAARFEASLALEAAEARQKTAEREVMDAETGWSRWLSESGFSSGFSPEDCEMVFQLARAAREARHNLENMRAEARRSQEYVAQMRLRIASALSSLGTPEDPEKVSPRHLEELAHRLQVARENEARRKQLQEELSKKQETLRALEAELDEVYASAGVTGEEAFVRLCDEAERWRQNQGEIEKLQRELCAIAGTPEALSRLQKDLESTDPETVTSERSSLETELPRLKEELENALREETICRSRLTQLASDEKLSQALQERRALALAIEEAVTNWAAHALCAALITQTKLIYERERQPSVLRAAQEYLDEISGTDYKLVQDIVSQGIELESGNLSRKKEYAWSRGLGEQVYLAVRLALADEFARDREAPPIILDDVLVNCDPERQLGVARVIARFAKKHQVLMFTCHPELVDRVRAGARQAGYAGPIPCYTLKDGTITSVSTSVNPTP